MKKFYTFKISDNKEATTTIETMDQGLTPETPETLVVLKVMYDNVRSLLNKYYKVGLLIDRHHPDIIGFTETWLNDDISDPEISYRGYNLYRTDRYGNCRAEECET